MLVQYLVGLCCLKWEADAVAVTIGDMVLDQAAGKKRDVDVTVVASDPAGGKHVFKAYEVKREATPIDVSQVEALCQKLSDMPSVDRRAIVRHPVSRMVRSRKRRRTTSTFISYEAGLVLFRSSFLS